jgi:uncharacterized phage protein (TIGR02218 family)
MGFTSHDRNIKLREADHTHVVYRAKSSLDASAVRTETGSGVDNLEVIGLLQDDRISEDDLHRGIYDGAAVWLFLVNFRNLDAGRITLLRGNVGEVNWTGSGFRAELRSLAGRLQQQIGEMTSSQCRVRALGDNRCKVNLDDFQETHTCDEVTDPYRLRFGGDGHASDYYTYGRLVGTDGVNEGYEREVKDHSHDGGGAHIILQRPFPYNVAVGDHFILEAGCDRRFPTCKNRFDNVVNFRGEPHIPGNDKLLKLGRHKSNKVS